MEQYLEHFVNFRKLFFFFFIDRMCDWIPSDEKCLLLKIEKPGRSRNLINTRVVNKLV